MRPIFKKPSTWIAALIVAALGFWIFKPGPPPPPQISSGELMKAVVYREYGPPDVVHVEEVDKLLPNDNQVLVKVRAAAVNPLDWHTTRGTPYIIRMGNGFRKPKNERLGTDFAGEIVALGKAVTDFKVGDAVYGVAGGTFAEFARANHQRIALKPAAMSFEQAAAIPVAAITALQGLRDHGKLKQGQKVLINGSSGGVGTYAVQLAKSYGAEITAVCSTRNVELVRSLGAARVIDYTKEDVTSGTDKYDLIVDNVGNLDLSDARGIMTKEGIYVGIGGGGPDAGNWIGALSVAIRTFFYSPFVSQDFGFFVADITRADLELLNGLYESGQLTSVIDRTYPLDQTAEAVRYLESGRARGKVIVVP